MTILSRLLAFFPFLHGLLGALAAIGALANLGEPLHALVLGALAIGVVYLLAPALYRLHQWLRPMRQGFSAVTGKDYSPWWGGHQIQGLYIAFPALEAALRLVPGVYSAWLRLWGAKVGRGVYWTPRIEIIDRALIEVGDGVVFGHRSVLCSHVIVPKGKNLRLYAKAIRIGSGALLGAEARLGPGCQVAPGFVIPYATSSRVNQCFGEPVTSESKAYPEGVA